MVVECNFNTGETRKCTPFNECTVVVLLKGNIAKMLLQRYHIVSSSDDDLLTAVLRHPYMARMTHIIPTV
jgi:hypothetical protein